ncbi:MAG: hypothetical protein CSB49_05300 [Proteobacteria bacterium]|nr:MAG: hypothetical protein CSB49_05300 [Pseudomonadota bacterium]
MLSVTIAPVLMLLLTAPLAGCLEDDVGVRCELKLADPEKPTTSYNFQALDCESRLCLSFKEGAAGPRCTIPCESDDDCPSDEVSGCKKFVCRVGLLTGTNKCCKFCVCRVDAGDTDEDAKTCAQQGISPQCPNI